MGFLDDPAIITGDDTAEYWNERRDSDDGQEENVDSDDQEEE